MSRDRIQSPQVNGVGGSTMMTMGGGGGGYNSPSVKSASLGEIWEDLQQGIESIYQQQTMPKARYMILYTYELISTVQVDSLSLFYICQLSLQARLQSLYKRKCQTCWRWRFAKHQWQSALFASNADSSLQIEKESAL